MRSTLAPTSVSMPADQKLLVKDVYEVEGGQGNTSVVDVLKDVGSDITKSIRTTPGVATRIAQMAVEAKTGRLTTAGALMKVGQLLGGRQLNDKLSNKLVSGISNTFGMDPRLTDHVMTVVKDSLGNQSRTYNQRGMGGESATSLVSMLQRVLGDHELIGSLDLGAEAAMIGELLNQSVRAGIPSAVDALLRSAADDNQRRYIVTRNISPILFSGDIATMEAVLNHVSPSSVASLRPNFSTEFLANFKLPVNTRKDEHLSYKTRIITLLDRINPNWPVGLRNGIPMYTLEPFSRASRDSKVVFAASRDYSMQMLVAEKFTAKTVQSLIKGQYPYFPI